LALYQPVGIRLASGEGETMRVETALVVDDSKVVQFKLRRMLEARGLEVEVASSGQESLDCLKLDLPDVIFMDSMMPDMDGFEVTGMITAKPETAAIPVIICTGNDTPEAREQARASGASGFVIKPVDDATLDALLVQLRQGVAAIAPVAARAPVAAPPPVAARTPAATPAPLASAPPPRAVPAPATEDIARIVERIAREVVERLVREATEVLSAESGQASRRIAQEAAGQAVDDALASWRKEVADTHERTELAAITAATGAAREIAQHARDEADAALRANETAGSGKLQEALASIQPIAERAARESADKTIGEAEAARQAAAAAADEKLRESLATVQPTAERAAREALESARTVMEEASRQVLESARADLQESVRITAEAVARPAAETAGRSVAEQLLQVSLAAAREDEAASRRQLEERAIAVAERVGRELVKLTFDAAMVKGQPAAGEREISEAKALDQAAMSAAATPERPARTSWAATPVLVPWLAAVTLGVLYLLARSFL
jgi:CheY-like chemotaxis protein